MSTWILEPRDTLVLRDGRPMEGASAMVSLRIPFPSSTAGFFRTRAGSDAQGRWLGGVDVAKQTPVHGPWLVELDDKNVVVTPFLPAPRDCVFFDTSKPGDKTVDKERAWRAALLPQRPQSGELVGLPDDLATVCGFGPAENRDVLKQKPQSAPSFWRWDAYASWLLKPDSGEVQPNAIGFHGAEVEVRTHVAIDGATQTAKDGALFSLEHVRFALKKEKGLPARLGLAVGFPDDMKGQGLREGTFAYAGERRLVHLRKSNTAQPAIPKGLLDAIEKDGKVRVVLVTPAHFEQGWRPTWLLQEREGVTPRLVGACVDRPVTVSGWDMAAPKGGQPKPTRRLAAAGSVYFLELQGDAAARRKWVEKHWWQPVSDDEASRLEGFGLAAIGAGGGLW